MDIVKSPPTDERLLFSTLEDMRSNSELWLSDLEFWKSELLFFQDLLDKYAPGIKKMDNKKRLDHFQNLIIYYNGELLDEKIQMVRRHGKNLNGLLETTDIVMLDEHRKCQDQVYAISRQLKEYKLELYGFVESIW